MLTRTRVAVYIALVLAAAFTSTALAKGSFAFITVSSASLENEVWLNDTALTQDWFAFADYQRGAVQAPAQPPGGGYVIVRFYIDGGRRSAFDELHYYPEAGLVYYDGLRGGSSEYDGKWYAANPAMKSVFERAVRTRYLQEAARRVAFIRRS